MDNLNNQIPIFVDQVLIKLIKPYTRIHIPFISKELNIDASEVESLLVSCILDSTIRGRIDQVWESKLTKAINSGILQRNPQQTHFS